MEPYSDNLQIRSTQTKLLLVALLSVANKIALRKSADYQHNYLLKFPDKVRGLRRRWRLNKSNREKELSDQRARRKLERQKNPSKARDRDRINYYKNRDQKLEYKRRNISHQLAIAKLRRERNPEVFRAKLRSSYRKRISNPDFKLKTYLGNKLRRRFVSRSGKLPDMVGCSFDELKRHLERQFKPGMSWSNYGKFGWHVDHRVPMSKHDLTKPDEVKRCFHWTNLQPLWWRENLSKRERIGREFKNTQPTLGL